jgi:Uma2 family endonuclease
MKTVCGLLMYNQVANREGVKPMVLPVLVEVNSVQGPPQGHWTYTDWENLADDGNCYEIIDGVLYMSTSPSLFHNWIIKRLYVALGQPAEELHLAFAFLDRVGVLMPGCDPVQPDFVLVLAEHASILHDRRIRGVPDLIAEVISPGSMDYDEDVKLQAYARAGVPEYVLIDPAKRLLLLYQLKTVGDYGAPHEFKVGDIVRFACLPDIPVEISQLFAGAPDTTL